MGYNVAYKIVLGSYMDPIIGSDPTPPPNHELILTILDSIFREILV